MEKKVTHMQKDKKNPQNSKIQREKRILNSNSIDGKNIHWKFINQEPSLWELLEIFSRKNFLKNLKHKSKRKIWDLRKSNKEIRKTR